MKQSIENALLIFVFVLGAVLVSELGSAMVVVQSIGGN